VLQVVDKIAVDAAVGKRLLQRDAPCPRERADALRNLRAAVLLGDGADGADGADGELHAFLALYAKLSDEDRAALRAYMRKLLESGG